MARLTSDVGTQLICLSSGSLQLVADLVLATGIFFVLALLSWPLAVASLAALPLFWLSYRRHSPRISALAKRVQEQNAAVYALLSERLSAIRTVRASGSEQRELTVFDSQLDEQIAHSRRNLNANAAQGLAALLIGGLAAGIIVCLAALLIHHRWLTLGEAVAFVAYLALVYQPLIRLAQFYGGIAATLAAVERITEILDEPEPSLARSPRSLGAVQGEIEFRNVAFRYRADGPLALERLNLHIQPGSTVGIYGPSGAGKSTLLALVPRLYELPSGRGRILLDGRDIRSLRVAELRRQVRYVPQQARLFEGTIRSNLTYATRDASEGLLWRVLEAVALDELVDSLPQGLDTRVGERGASLSGGQRQRMALARALIARPRVLLLDDCVSALDGETAARVRERIADLRPEQTRLIVSHDPHAFANADWLVVLDGGRVAGQGRPREILVDSMSRPELGNLPPAGQTVVQPAGF
jgi:ABC-type multidrug transport system fused ATPase/permease subunit